MLYPLSYGGEHAILTGSGVRVGTCGDVAAVAPPGAVSSTGAYPARLGGTYRCPVLP